MYEEIREMYKPSLSDFKKDYVIHRNRIVIYGKHGCGKTTLAHLLLKEYDTLTIDTKYLKQHEIIRQLVCDHTEKRNVLTLLKGLQKPKAIVFDNADTFHAYDETSFKLMMGHFRDTPKLTMILICHPSFYKNRTLQKSIFQEIYLTYTVSAYKEAIGKISSELGIVSTAADLTRIAGETDFNFHNVYEILNGPTPNRSSKTLVGDYLKDISDITREIVENTYGYEDLVQLVESDHVVVGLNLLENAFQGIHSNIEKDASDIYKNYMLSDMFEIYMNRHTDWYMREYVILFSVYSLYLYYKRRSRPPRQLIYNKYISRAMTAIGNQGALMNINTIDGIYGIDDIYYHFYHYINKSSETSADILRCLSPKQVRLVSKGFSTFYHITPTNKQLKRLIS